MSERPKVYLAGKIRKNCWRHDIVRGLRGAWEGYEAISGHGREPEPWPVLRGAVLGRADYVGPYFTSCDHGCAHSTSGHFGPTHGLTGGCIEAAGGGTEYGARRDARRRCLDAIHQATLVFAHIESPDAHGTLVELGFAVALGKWVHVNFATPQLAEEMWFAAISTLEPFAGQATVHSDPITALEQQLPKPRPKMDSPAEEKFWDAYERTQPSALDGLVTQHKVGRYRLDFAVPDRRVAIEIDGHAYHSSPEQFEKDRVRHRALEMDGWRIIRFSGKEALNAPDRCVAEAAAFASCVVSTTGGA